MHIRVVVVVFFFRRLRPQEEKICRAGERSEIYEHFTPSLGSRRAFFSKNKCKFPRVDTLFFFVRWFSFVSAAVHVALKTQGTRKEISRKFNLAACMQGDAS